MLKSFSKNTRRFFEPLRLEKKEAIKSAANSLLTVIYFDVLPTVTIPTLLYYISTGNQEGVLKLLVVVSLVLVVAFIIRYFFMPGWFWYGDIVSRAKLELKYRRIILLKDNVVFESKGTGKVQSIVDRGLSTWATLINETVWYVVSTTSVFVLGLYMVFSFGPLYIIGFSLMIAISCAWYFYFKQKQYEIQLPERDVQTEYNALQTRTIMSRGEILLSDKIDVEAKKLAELSLKAHKIKTASDRPGVLAVNTIESVMTVLPFVGVYIFIILKNGSSLTSQEIAMLTAFTVFSSRMSVMIWSFLSFVGRIMSDLPDIKKFWDFLDETPDIIGYDDGKDFVYNHGNIRLENVSFSYGEESSEVLNNFSIAIPGGAKLALVGRSGSGKTTIAKLVTGYMRPTTGTVLVDNQDLSTVALKTYYKHVGYLTQEPMVFDGTVRENLIYGVGEKVVNDEEIVSALRKAECDFVMDSKDGLETQIGEKGIRLSGGERQRLAIAKLLLKNPEIIVLDEPTSALDSFSEEAITRALDELFKGRTVIIIAHRLQTVKRADKIIVLEKGAIVEEGTHKELIDKGGEYARMLEMQSGF